jgi:branched-chain amino acid aminotransferase
MNFICFNGEMIRTQALFTPQNRGFRYGDGVFETIKVFRGNIILEEYHFDRLFTALGLLKIQIPVGREIFAQKILGLCNLNSCIALARVRLAVYRDEGNRAGFVIEANSLDIKTNQLNENGWTIDIYPFARKSCDVFSNLKSANYLPYVLADMYAQEISCQESIVLNAENNLCDASKANIFLLIKDEVYTPALHQGCVDGVKRRYVIDELKKRGIVVHQQVVEEKLLVEAEEVFLTNAINDIRWVNAFRDKSYRNSFIKEFYKKTISPIYR